MRDDNKLASNQDDHYRQLVESVEDYAIYLLDTKGIISSWNTGAEKIKGYKADEVLGKHVSLFYERRDIERQLPMMELKTALEIGRFEGEGWRIRKDGSIFYANLIITPVYDKEKNHIGFAKVTRDLTEWKKAERAVEQAENRFKLLIDGVETIRDYAIFVLDENGFISTWNAGAERINGYKENEIIGKHFSTFYPKDAIEAGYPDYELSKAGAEGRFEDEGWRIRKDGSMYWANVVLSAIYTGNKKVAGFTKVVRDLSERKKAEQSLKETENKYKLLIEGVQDYAIFLLDTDGCINSWNAGAERIKGYKSEEILGKHFSVFYPKKAIEENFPDYELREAKEKGRFEDQGWRIRKDGNVFWANVVITAIYNKEHQLIGFSKITRDLTQQKKTERQLRESEEKFRLMIGSITDYAIFMLDPHGNIATWNTGAEKIKGYSSEDIIGKHFSIFYPEDAIKADFPNTELKVAREVGKFEHEGWRIRKDGSRFWANVIINAVRNFDNKLIGFSKITRDLTERRIYESELERKNAELTRVNADLDSFVYTASHDLKAPISNIEGLITTLLDSVNQGCNENDIKGMLAMMEKSVTRFKATIYQLAEITKIQRESFNDSELIEIKSVVEETKESISELISTNNAKINLNNAKCSTIRFVRPLLKSVFYNLISNAIKYRSPQHEPIIEITCSESDNYTIIDIKDNGLGIEESNKEKIFQMFKRLHDHVQGSGVGLFMVKRIMDNSGAKIEVDSAIGRGTTFRLFFRKQL